MGRPGAIIRDPGPGRPRNRLKALAAMVKTPDRCGIRAEVRATAGPGDATRLAHDAVADGSPMIAVHGGDGTVKRGAGGGAWVQMDGELWARLPVMLEYVPAALSLVLP